MSIITEAKADREAGPRGHSLLVAKPRLRVGSSATEHSSNRHGSGGNTSNPVRKAARNHSENPHLRLQIFVLMPHARSAHHPRSASNKTNNPETSNSTPGKTENWRETIAVTSRTTPARPRTIRPLVSMLREKYLFISFGVCFAESPRIPPSASVLGALVLPRQLQLLFLSQS